MNIKKVDTASDASEKFCCGMAAKPAVRVVTDWNAAASSFCPAVIGPSVAGLFHSSSAVSAVPSRNSPALKASTSRVYIPGRFLRQRSTSVHTRKPSPPSVMSAMIVRHTTGSV